MGSGNRRDGNKGCLHGLPQAVIPPCTRDSMCSNKPVAEKPGGLTPSRCQVPQRQSRHRVKGKILHISSQYRQSIDAYRVIFTLEKTIVPS